MNYAPIGIPQWRFLAYAPLARAFRIPDAANAATTVQRFEDGHALVTVHLLPQGDPDNFSDNLVSRIIDLLIANQRDPNTFSARFILYNPNRNVTVSTSALSLHSPAAVMQEIELLLEKMIMSDEELDLLDLEVSVQFLTSDGTFGAGKGHLLARGCTDRSSELDSDWACGYAALVDALYTPQQRKNSKRKRTRNGTRFQQDVRQLVEQLGAFGTPCTATTLTRVVQLPKYVTKRIVVFNYRGDVLEDIRGPGYVGLTLPDDADKEHIYLYLGQLIGHPPHFVRIHALPVFLSPHDQLVCRLCFKLYNRLAAHKCAHVMQCSRCNLSFTEEAAYQEHEHTIDPQAQCPHCKRILPEQCIAAHQLTCHIAKIKTVCVDCNTPILPGETHVCGIVPLKYCKTCHTRHIGKPENGGRTHCFWNPHQKHVNRKTTDEESNYVLYTFDLETLAVQETVTIAGESRLVHWLVPNLMCVHEAETPSDQILQFYGYEGEQDCIEQFNAWLEQQCHAHPNREYRFIAHNFSGFDGKLLWDFYTKRSSVTIRDATWNGAKLMELRLPGRAQGKHTKPQVYFLDSRNHLPGTLASLPKTLDLQDVSVAKGHFPHKFNTVENQHYVGSIPSLAMFEPDHMRTETRAAFLEWYAQQSDVVWDFQKELRTYCDMDVYVLSKCVLQYRSLMMQLTDMDPWRCTTIAAYAFKVFCVKDLPAYQKRVSVDQNIYPIAREFVELAREALKGGRTSAIRKHYKTDDIAGVLRKTTGLRYDDVNSLYPSVQVKHPMPVGKPKRLVFREDAQPQTNIMQTFFGFARVDLDPPNDLYHPVVGYTDPDLQKFIFGLRPLKAVVLTSVELQKALEMGYVLRRVYEVDIYKKSDNLFRSYIERFYRIKTLCGGWKGTEEALRDYSKRYCERLGVVCDAPEAYFTLSDFVKNPGLKLVAKLLLNSLWGKFGQRYHLQSYVGITTHAEFVRYIDRERRGEVHTTAVYPQSNHLSITCRDKSQDKERMDKTYAPVAAFVTAYGRLALYEGLQRMGERVVYYDTDSMIYEAIPGQNMEAGDLLGDWETEYDGAHLHEFVGVAPKTYGIKTHVPIGIDKLPTPLQEFVPVGDAIFETTHDGDMYRYDPATDQWYKEYVGTRQKGFTSSYANQNLLSFEAYKAKVLQNVPIEANTTVFQWTRNTPVHVANDVPTYSGMYVTSAKKVLDGTNTKGWCDAEGKYWPWGHRNVPQGAWEAVL